MGQHITLGLEKHLKNTILSLSLFPFSFFSCPTPCVCVCMYICMSMYACGIQKKRSGVVSQGLFTLFFETRSLTDWNWPCRLEPLARNLIGPSVPTFPVLELQVYTIVLGLGVKGLPQPYTGSRGHLLELGTFLLSHRGRGQT